MGSNSCAVGDTAGETWPRAESDAGSRVSTLDRRLSRLPNELFSVPTVMWWIGGAGQLRSAENPFGNEWDLHLGRWSRLLTLISRRAFIFVAKGCVVLVVALLWGHMWELSRVFCPFAGPVFFVVIVVHVKRRFGGQLE